MTDMPDAGLHGWLGRFGGHIDRFAHWYYLAIAVPVIVFLALVRAPLGAPDEWAHVARAAQVADGVILTGVVDGVPQALVHENLRHLQLMIADQHRFQPVPQWRPLYDPMPWGETAIHGFNQAVYFPVTYLPQALALVAASWVGLGILDSLVLGSLITGFACVGLGALAVRLSPVAKIPMVVLLSLPMTLFLSTSFSSDGLMIGLAVVLSAAVARLWMMDDPRQAYPLTLLAVGAALLLAPAKLVYTPAAAAALAILMFHPRADGRYRMILAGAAALVAIAAAGWHIVSNAGDADYGPGDAARQLAFTLEHPFAVLAAFVATLREFGQDYVDHIVGVLGWLDGRLSPWLYGTLMTMFGVAVVAEALGTRPAHRLPWWVGVGLLGAVLVCVGGIFFSIYLIWTPPETAVVIEGVQGRYFLPLIPVLLLLLLALPRVPSTLWSDATRGLLCLAVVVPLPILVQGAVYEAILRRYYF